MRPNYLKVLGLFALTLALGGCVSGDGSAGAPASPLFTGSIPVSPAGPKDVSDRDVVRAAVSAPDAAAGATAGIPWANASTGTTGVISQIVEADVGGETCRTFQTSRHGYDGVVLFVGQACRTPGGAWRMIEFRPKRGADTTGRPDGTGAATG